MYCSACGRLLSDGDRFCGECGASVQPLANSAKADTQPKLASTATSSPVFSSSVKTSQPHSTASSTLATQIDPIAAPKGGNYQSHSAPTSNAVAGRTGAENAGHVASIIVLLGFFMPYISCQGLMGKESASGYQLASRGASGLWVIPISMVIAIIVLITKSRSIRDRTRVAATVIGSGLASIVVMLYYYARLNGAGEQDEFGFAAAMRQAFSIEIGAILSLVGSIALAICGFIHLQSSKKSLGLGKDAQGLPRTTSASS